MMRKGFRAALCLCAAWTAQATAQTANADKPAAADQPPAQAASPENRPPASAPSPIMLTGVAGDWGGLRTRLFDKGFDFQLSYTNQFAANTQGGIGRDAVDSGQAMLGMFVDTNKLIGIPGGRLRVLVTRRHGVDLNTREKLGLIQNLQGLWGRGNIWRLGEAWYEQTFDGGKFSLRVGRSPTSLEFGTTTCDTENRSFCGAPPGNMPNTYTYWLSYPASAWMARAKVNFGARNDAGYLQAAVFQTNPHNADTTNGFRLGLAGGTGVMIPVEAGWTPRLWTDRPGIFKIGGWYESSPTTDIFEDRNGRPVVLSGLPGRPLRGRYGGYFEIRQQITPSPKGLGRKGLTAFLNVFEIDRRTSLVDNYVGMGLVQTGTFKGRPNDQIALQVSRTHVNSRLAEADRILNGIDPLHGVRGSEYAAELDYRLVPMTGLRIIPNLQYVANPGGFSNHRNIVVLGIMTSVAL